MIKFVHSADIHLDSPLQRLARYEGAPVEAVRQASRRALEALVQLALTERVDLVLIAGDLYDGDWKDYNTGLFFVSQMTRLREAQIPVAIVSGNHDAANRMTKMLRHPDNVHILPSDRPTTIVLESPGLAIHGQGFAKPAVSDNLAVGLPPALNGLFNIGLLHTSVSGRTGHAPYAPCSLEDLRSKEYQYWALGHVHTREQLADDPPIHFCGNIQGRHIRESGPKGCLLVTAEAGGSVETRFHALDVIRWERLDVACGQCAHRDDLLDRIRDAVAALLRADPGQPRIVRLVLNGHMTNLDELLGRPEHWRNDVRSLVIDASDGLMWIEKIDLRLQPPKSGQRRDEQGPQRHIEAVIANALKEPQQMGQVLAPLYRKLPADLADSGECPQPEDADGMRALIRDAAALLLARLRHGESSDHAD